MKMNRRQFAVGGASLLGAGVLGVNPALSQDRIDLSGETVDWLIPYGEGGGADTWARLYAPYLSKYLPGSPNVTIRNLPGGGSVTGANEFAARARPDGTSLFGPSSSTFLPYLLNLPHVRYDLLAMRPALISPTGGVVYIPSTFGVASAAELSKLQETELVYAAQAPVSVDLVAMLAFLTLGLDVRFVFGMAGRGEGRLAFERGEATIDYQSTPGYLTNVQPMLDRGEIVPLFSWGVLDAEGNVQRDPTFPDLPHFVEACQMALGDEPSGPEFEAYMAFFSASFAAPRPALLPADAPDAVVETFREAFALAVADPDLQANGVDIIGSYAQITGKDTEAVLRAATSISPESQEWVRSYLRANHNAEL